MSGTGTAIDTIRRTVSAMRDDPGRVVRRLVVAAALLCWSGFWSLVARTHYLRGHLVDAGFTALVTIGPALWIAAGYAGAAFDADLPISNGTPGRL